jgi:hypothetical protein
MLEGTTYQSFWVQNCITVEKASLSLIKSLSEHPSVDYIGSDEMNEQTLPQELPYLKSSKQENKNEPEWYGVYLILTTILGM